MRNEKMKTQKLLTIALATIGIVGMASAAFVVNGSAGSQECDELFAQQAGPRGGGQGGPGGQQGQGGQRGGMQMRGPQGGPTILRDPKVQIELKLTDQQKSQIQQVLEEMRPQGGPGGQGQGGQGQGGGQRGQGGQGQGGQGQGGGQRGQGGQGGQGGPGAELIQQIEAKLKTILNDGQFNRYQQLSLQASGPMAFMRPDVVQKLGITEQQQQQMRAIMEANRPPRPEPGQGGQGEPPQPPNPEEMKARMDKLMNELLGVLNGNQRNQWNQMTGAKFEFSPPQQGRGGRAGGGGGGELLNA